MSTNNRNDYLHFMLKISGAENISKKVNTCGQYLVNYDKCIEKSETFDKCYDLYYQKFLQCCKEIDINENTKE